MSKRWEALLGRAARRVRSQFFVGILLAVPVVATILALVWIFNTVDEILRPFVRMVFGRPIPGIGFGTTVVLIYLAGVVGSSLVGKRLVSFSENLLERVPVVRSIYGLTKQVMEGFSSSATTGFKNVVLIEYPRAGVLSIAFVTNEFHDGEGTTYCNVFIPTTPNLTSGFLRVMRNEDVTRVSLSVDEAVKMLVSFGRVTPVDIGDKLSRRSKVRGTEHVES